MSSRFSSIVLTNHVFVDYFQGVLTYVSMFDANCKIKFSEAFRVDIARGLQEIEISSESNLQTWF